VESNRREDELRAVTVGELRSLQDKVRLAEYDPGWPAAFEQEATRIRAALGERVIRLDHVGSTSVPGLAAKPILDMLLVVADSSDERWVVPDLEATGYVLRIREPDWFEHRMLKKTSPDVNLHVFSEGCPEVDRMLLFRDWLRDNESDRALYERTKRELATRDWKYLQDYADAKTAVVQEIMARAQAWAGRPAPAEPA
jgi:GrpB-like predicted nucleotidyltransferase (UPF0157 family)